MALKGALLAAVLTFGMARSVFADDGDDGPRRWYGWQLMLTDAAGLAFGGAAIPSSASGTSWIPLVVAGGTFYLFGAPVVHGFHRRPGAAAGSFLLRILVPTAIGGIVYAVTPGGTGEDAWYPKFYGGVAGLGAGAILAMGIDWIALAREPVAERSARVAVAPVGKGLRLVAWF